VGSGGFWPPSQELRLVDVYIFRLNELLELLIRKHELARISERLGKQRQEYAQSPISELVTKIKQNATSKTNLR
jgi:hypothetical protein